MGPLCSGVHQFGRRWKNRQVARGLGDLLDGLDSGGPGADHRHPLSLEADRVLGPEAGVIGLAPEVVDAREPRQGRRRQRAGGGDQVAGPVGSAVLQGDLPRADGLVEVRRLDSALELDVPAQVKLVGDVVEIALGLWLGREMLGPAPFVQQLLAEGVAVGVALGIEAAARIAVPVPGAADAGAGLEHPDRLAHLPQAVELVQTGNAGPDDDGVAVEAPSRLAHLSALLSRSRRPRIDDDRVGTEDILPRRGVTAAFEAPVLGCPVDIGLSQRSGWGYASANRAVS
jgi:hypothetical protein